ncbi:MAG: DJ-1/PfpI family protein [Alphaproteobacteria bacterium]|nr:DJ-1/PfpI family protein [Alphaproteobacteria bacterium]
MSDQKRLSGMTVAVLVANGFEEIVMTDAQKALAAEGAAIRIVSHEVGLANGWHEGTWGHNFYIDTRISDALPSDFDGMLVPGGERSIAALRENAHARRVVKGMLDAGKLVAMVGDAVEMLVAAEAARGRKVAGAESARARVEAMGAVWSEASLATDGNLITAANSEELESLIAAVIGSLLAAPEGERQQAA